MYESSGGSLPGHSRNVWVMQISGSWFNLLLHEDSNDTFGRYNNEHREIELSQWYLLNIFVVIRVSLSL